MSVTAYSLLTPPGQGAIAVIGVRGTDAQQIVSDLFRPTVSRTNAEMPLRRILFGRWKDSQGEELVVCRLTDNYVEINCHGGVAAPASICDDLKNAGCTAVSQTDWITEDSEGDLIKAEAWQALAEATTESCALILLDQWNGALAREVAAIVGRIAAGDSYVALQAIQKLISRSSFGQRLTRPWRIVLVGAPNVGKSSLINRIVGYERSIVHAEPGTTRDVVTSQAALHGWHVEFSDTAGQRNADDSLESAGIERGKAAMQQADLIVRVFDIRDCQGNTLFGEQLADQATSPTDPPCITVVNKCDLIGDAEPPQGGIATSATTGEGIAKLNDAIISKLIPQPPQSGDAVPFTTRQVALLHQAMNSLNENQPDEAMLSLARLACAEIPDLPPGFPQI